MRQIAKLFLLLGLLAGCIGEVPASQLNVLLTTPESSLDPAVASDIPSVSLNENIFEPMLRYDYLARPLKLKPNTLSAMPQLSEGGKTYTLHLQPGILFSPHPLFAGRPRELVASDYVYSIQRLYDPQLKSPWLFMFEGKLLGDQALRAAGGDAARFDVHRQIAGLRAIDKYTLQIRLNQPDPNFLFILASTATGAVAEEVISHYGGEAGNHPVGTGPFMMADWQRSFRMTLVRNPAFRKLVFDGEPGADPDARQIARRLQGKTLPLVDRVRVMIVEEHQARVLGFLGGQFDYLEQLPPPLAEMVLKDGRLKPELEQRGIRLSRFATLQTYYVWMNMEDPVLGGYRPEQIALRRAIALSYNAAEDIRLMEKGLAIAAQSPLPPNVIGYDSTFRNPVQYDPQLANALLDHFAYRRGADHYRNLPDGRPLLLTMMSEANTTGRLRDEVWRRNLDAIGIRVRFKSDKHSEVLRAARLGQAQMAEANWVADFPDGENFYQLLYGGNVGRANYARFNLPAFNQAYEQARSLPDGPPRQALYRKMNLLIAAYNPWVARIYPLSADLAQPWLLNHFRHPVYFTDWRYLDIADGAQQKTN